MGVSRLTVVVLVIRLGVLALACKPLRFSSLARLWLRGRVLRIVYCVAFRCVIQVISLSGAGRCC
jgi:hypothetical protein